MVSSRIFIWQRLTRLTDDGVLQAIALCHPVWAGADPDDITFADNHAARGNFRNWARLTARTHTHMAMERTGRARVGQEVLRWAFQPPRFGRIGPWPCPRRSPSASPVHAGRGIDSRAAAGAAARPAPLYRAPLCPAHADRRQLLDAFG
ncbi:hypothetical protein GCM10020000_74830 [Streptomyces olivoverticillatus]